MRNPMLHTGLLLAMLAAATPVAADVVLPPAIAASPRLKDLRRSMMAGRELSDRQLQVLADAGEGLAAARYARRLEERGLVEYLDDAAHYYSIAVYADREFAIPRLIAILRGGQAEFGPARLRNIREVLDREARTDPVAAAGLAELLLRGKPFEQDVPRARELLLAAAEAGDFKAGIRLAQSHFTGAPGLPPDPEGARRPLELALSSPDPGVQSIARTLLNQLPGGVPEFPPAPPAPAAEDWTTVSLSLRPRLRPETLQGATR
ncbi:hypothetical protein [Tabrizicola soli]|uniref:Sel1 repeat family protein n=1 Tax=Tabrizicola soli TaxID=2185115 RepID=A0ABV7DNP7_9RHOB|nr:hypothetical protein [Tabrizicola soli]